MGPHAKGTRISPLRDGSAMFLEMLKIRWNGIREIRSRRKVMAGVNGWG